MSSAAELARNWLMMTLPSGNRKYNNPKITAEPKNTGPAPIKKFPVK